MDVTHHLDTDSELKAGTAAKDVETHVAGRWVSVILDGCDITVFGEVEQLVEVGRLFLSQAIALRDAQELLDAAALQ
jgi:hypothetical protein